LKGALGGVELIVPPAAWAERQRVVASASNAMETRNRKIVIFVLCFSITDFALDIFPKPNAEVH